MRSHTVRVKELISTRKHCLSHVTNLITYEAESAVWIQTDLSGIKATRSGFECDLNGALHWMGCVARGARILWNGMQIGHPHHFQAPHAGNTYGGRTHNGGPLGCPCVRGSWIPLSGVYYQPCRSSPAPPRHLGDAFPLCTLFYNRQSGIS